MRFAKTAVVGLAVLATVAFSTFTACGEDAPYIYGFGQPSCGYMQIIFYGSTGPFYVQTKASLTNEWTDVPNAVLMQLRPGIYQALVSNPSAATNVYYRVVSKNDPGNELEGWMLLLRVSTPSNGTHFVVGERPVVTVNVLDTLSQGLRTNDLSSLNLYLYGPQDPLQTVTASKLLNASTNRSSNPHHYISLLKTNSALQVYGNVLTYTLQPVTDEAPGTYTFAVRATLASDPVQQTMSYSDIQIRTSTVETPVMVKSQCGECHEGPVSGKTYMHHIDPRNATSTGSWIYDYEPAKSCKACHNNDGYAAYSDASVSGGKVSDHIVLRVHGIHMGGELLKNFNTNSVDGNFADYTDVVFPADVRNCTRCHTDDRWKTNPSRLACGACHDNFWFGSSASLPAGMTMHSGGTKTNDATCFACHPADGPIDPDSISYPVAATHEVPPTPMGVMSISMSTPSNGSYYVAGEMPVASLVFFDDSGTNRIDHTMVTESNFSAANFYVYGPRSESVPVLTSAASNGIALKFAAVTCTSNGPWAISNQVLRIAINGSAPQDITIPGTSTLVSAAQVVAALNPVITNLNGGAVASVSSSTKVKITSLVSGLTSRVAIYNGTVTSLMGWKANGVTLEPDITVPTLSSAPNDLRRLYSSTAYNDPRVTRTTSNITYQLSDVGSLPSGTYVAFSYMIATSNKVPGVSNSVSLCSTTFQVGTATQEKKIAANCTSCHGDTVMHLYEEGAVHNGPLSTHLHPAYFDTDQCKACHDYGRSGVANAGELYKNQGGTSLDGWSGYGSMPISRRVHGVHFAHYIDHPEQIYANATTNTFGGIIFPQDVRNCTECHSESDTWKQKASRAACLSCHDSDMAKAHGSLMTFMTDTSNPYGPGSTETCETCHGEGKSYSPDTVHSVSNPYVQPYVREP